ncbi:hypothetical protein, partial [Roseibacillus persicicus]|uniref:hypothetical protein n=1 Tax=Roseibacillus persicicus TaxID=454148 RepID=UPI00280E6DFF
HSPAIVGFERGLVGVNSETRRGEFEHREGQLRQSLTYRPADAGRSGYAETDPCDSVRWGWAHSPAIVGFERGLVGVNSGTRKGGFEYREGQLWQSLTYRPADAGVSPKPTPEISSVGDGLIRLRLLDSSTGWWG